VSVEISNDQKMCGLVKLNHFPLTSQEKTFAGQKCPAKEAAYVENVLSIFSHEQPVLQK
jgi:hypothetical protein